MAHGGVRRVEAQPVRGRPVRAVRPEERPLRDAQPFDEPASATASATLRRESAPGRSRRTTTRRCQRSEECNDRHRRADLRLLPWYPTRGPSGFSTISLLNVGKQRILVGHRAGIPPHDAGETLQAADSPPRR